MKNMNKDETITNQENLKPKLNYRSLMIVLVCVFIAVVLTTIYVIISGARKTLNFASCQKGQTVTYKGAKISSVGIEDYQSQQYKDKVCHLTHNKEEVTADYYLDEQALAKFSLKGEKSKTVGNGCIVYRLAKVHRLTELCFGDKIIETAQGETGEENVDLFKELGIDLSQVEIYPTLGVFLKITPKSFAGTKWHYSIQVGGGVEGEITVATDEGGNMRGIYTEFGPEGKKEKGFTGSFESDFLLLTLEEFPTFKVNISQDGRSMTGKPLEESKDIFYPQDFFKASLVQ